MAAARTLVSADMIPLLSLSSRLSAMQEVSSAAFADRVPTRTNRNGSPLTHVCCLVTVCSANLKQRRAAGRRSRVMPSSEEYSDPMNEGLQERPEQKAARIYRLENQTGDAQADSLDRPKRHHPHYLAQSDLRLMLGLLRWHASWPAARHDDVVVVSTSYADLSHLVP